MPEQWAVPEELAASELSRWLSHPNELNAYPEEIELMQIYTLPEARGRAEAEVYLSRFREFPKPWEPGERWMAGVAGPYKNGRARQLPWNREHRSWMAFTCVRFVSISKP